MSKYLDLNIKEINELLKSKKIKPIDLVEESIDRIENSDLNAFITLDKDGARKKAKELENKKVDNLFFGIPIAIKDNICTKGIRTTAASHILDNFIPLYNATVIEKINNANMIIIGKTNMDEFAMGSTSRSSYFGAPLNPWNKERITGGSSGGNAAAVSARLIPIAIGSDTGGSIRQPSSYCGIVGMKPTYGRVSRYGLIAYGSSLDQIGPMTRNVYENACLLNVISGRDDKDLTSSSKEVEDFTRKIGKSIKGMKIAVPNFLLSDIVSSSVKNKIKEIIEILRKEEVSIDYIDIDYLENAVTLYQIIAMSEASSNLARFDGVRYGYSIPEPKSVDELYCKTREEGFGEEVKCRIMVGSYLLSGDNAKIYYNKALQIRSGMRESFKEAFKKYDLIIGPNATTVAYFQDEGLNDPLRSFYDDALVFPANMAGLPGMNVPIGFDEEHLPIGLQIIGNSWDESTMYQLAAFLEDKLKLNLDPREVK